MAPECSGFDVRVDGNGYGVRMSAEAAGITACLFAFSHLSFRISTDTMSRHYYWLLDFAVAHAEAAAILAAID